MAVDPKFQLPELRLEFDADFQSATRAVGIFVKFCKKNLSNGNWDAALAIDFQIGLTEIFNNIIMHAYGGREDNTIEFCAKFKNDLFFLEVRDSGNLFDLESAAASRRLNELQENGFGWGIINQVFDTKNTVIDIFKVVQIEIHERQIFRNTFNSRNSLLYSVGE